LVGRHEPKVSVNADVTATTSDIEFAMTLTGVTTTRRVIVMTDDTKRLTITLYIHTHTAQLLIVHRH